MKCCENCVWSKEKASYMCCNCLERSNFKPISNITGKQNFANDEEILDKRRKMCYNFHRNGAKTPKENNMKGYIKRLSKEIDQLDAKMQALVAFKDNPREPINDKQYELLCRQENLMKQLLDVLKLRLANEQEIHPDYFEDLPEKVDNADNCDEEITEE